MQALPLDVALYVRPPRLGIATGLSLGKMLLLVVPKKPGPAVLMAAKALAASVTATEADWRAADRPRPVRRARAADVRLDRAWGAVHRRLVDHENLPADDPDRVCSTALVDRLFPERLQFTQLRFVEEHAHSDRLLAIIDEEGLRADLEQLVGKRFVTELHEAHADYGVVLGITEAPEPQAPAISMIERLRELTQAVADYALQVLAYSRTHADHLAPARRALAPIDAFREAARKGGGGRPTAGDDEPSLTDDYALPEGAPAPDAPVPAVAEE